MTRTREGHWSYGFDRRIKELRTLLKLSDTARDCLRLIILKGRKHEQYYVAVGTLVEELGRGRSTVHENLKRMYETCYKGVPLMERCTYQLRRGKRKGWVFPGLKCFLMDADAGQIDECRIAFGVQRSEPQRPGSLALMSRKLSSHVQVAGPTIEPNPQNSKCDSTSLTDGGESLVREIVREIDTAMQIADAQVLNRFQITGRKGWCQAAASHFKAPFLESALEVAMAPTVFLAGAFNVCSRRKVTTDLFLQVISQLDARTPIAAELSHEFHGNPPVGEHEKPLASPGRGS